MTTTKTDRLERIQAFFTQMENPKTRKESKKDQKEKGRGKDGKYSQKHVRAVEQLKVQTKGKGS
jgi:hypothetical protein